MRQVPNPSGLIPDERLASKSSPENATTERYPWQVLRSAGRESFTALLTLVALALPAREIIFTLPGLHLNLPAVARW
jgi:hypothetical protein